MPQFCPAAQQVLAQITRPAGQQEWPAHESLLWQQVVPSQLLQQDPPTHELPFAQQVEPQARLLGQQTTPAQVSPAGQQMLPQTCATSQQPPFWGT